MEHKLKCELRSAREDCTEITNGRSELKSLKLLRSGTLLPSHSRRGGELGGVFVDHKLCATPLPQTTISSPQSYTSHSPNIRGNRCTEAWRV